MEISVLQEIVLMYNIMMCVKKNYDACRTQIIKWLIEKINDCKLEKTIDLSKNDFEAKQDFDKLKEYILEIVEKAIAKR